MFPILLAATHQPPAAWVSRLLPEQRGWLHVLAWVAAGLALAAAGGAWAAMQAAGHRGADADRRPRSVVLCQHTALFASAAAAVCLVLLVVVRAALVLLETLHGAPLEEFGRSIGFGVDGLDAVGVLGLAVLIAHRTTRSRRLVAPLFWLAVLGVVWLALLLPTYRPTPAGGYARNPGALILACGLATVLGATTGGWASGVRRRRNALLLTDRSPAEPIPKQEEPRASTRAAPDGWELWDRLSHDPMPDWPGLATSCGAVAVFLNLLVCFVLVVPVDLPIGGYRGASAVLTLASGVGAAAAFAVLGWRWSLNLADAAMGLATLSICALLTVIVPSDPAALADRFPRLFNAMLVGTGIMTGYWVWISGVWHQQLDHGRPWTTAGRLVGPADRFAFRVGLIGLVVASLMALWPKLRPIGAPDDSLPRVSFGIAGHLALLLATLYGARKTGRFSFTALAALTIISLLGFIGVRAVG